MQPELGAAGQNRHLCNGGLPSPPRCSCPGSARRRISPHRGHRDWPDTARLVEAHDGVWGGCWCTAVHPHRDGGPGTAAVLACQGVFDRPVPPVPTRGPRPGEPQRPELFSLGTLGRVGRRPTGKRRPEEQLQAAITASKGGLMTNAHDGWSPAGAATQRAARAAVRDHRARTRDERAVERDALAQQREAEGDVSGALADRRAAEQDRQQADIDRVHAASDGDEA